ncbi:hypothetical protein [Exiguobacterium flavidum]|uniref:hypothetical protein n=1 Tax=Exiguobacterium flavidum TaxID=2184695 RepID=UPI000DF852D1|nr:hypothetical protein [Exiguobacterium flavidum]
MKRKIGLVLIGTLSLAGCTEEAKPAMPVEVASKSDWEAGNYTYDSIRDYLPGMQANQFVFLSVMRKRTQDELVVRVRYAIDDVLEQSLRATREDYQIDLLLTDGTERFETNRTASVESISASRLTEGEKQEVNRNYHQLEQRFPLEELPTLLLRRLDEARFDLRLLDGNAEEVFVVVDVESFAEER